MNALRLVGVLVLALADAARADGGGKNALALEAEIRQLIGDGRCSADEQCRTLAFGAKACGGPQAYLAWSTLVTDEAALLQAARRHAERRRADLRDSGLMSDCALVVDPGASCAPAAASSASGMRICRLNGTPGRSSAR